MKYVVIDRYTVGEVTRFLNSLSVTGGGGGGGAQRLDYSVYELIYFYVYWSNCKIIIILQFDQETYKYINTDVV